MPNENTARAYKFIRSKILSSEFPPGIPLGTKPLAEKIGVSRTPVRDALRQLETDGLVVIRPRLGASVKFMSLQDFKEHCGLRQALEIYAAGRAAANRTDAELEEIRQALQSMRDLFATLKKRSDRDKYQAALAKEDIRFHMAIMTAAKNSLLKAEILRLHLINRVVAGVTPLYSAADMVGENSLENRGAATLKQHADIYNAIVERDVAVAKEAMEHHMQDMLDHSIRKKGVEESSRISFEFGL